MSQRFADSILVAAAGCLWDGLLHKAALWLMALWLYGLMGSVGIYGNYRISISIRLCSVSLL